MPSRSSSIADESERRHLSLIMQTLQGTTAVSYVLDSQYRILYCNPAWDTFAKANGAPHLTGASMFGFDLFDAVPEVLKSAYWTAFRQVLSTGNVWDKSYGCSSAEMLRIFRMRIHLLKKRNWFLITNTLQVERSDAFTNSVQHNPRSYVDANGLIVTCAHCRCCRRPDDPNYWDHIPEYVEMRRDSVYKFSHALCPVCRAYFYPPDSLS